MKTFILSLVAILIIAFIVSFYFQNWTEIWALEKQRAMLWINHCKNFFWFFVYGGLDL
jgi:lipopolysaccharide export LptBFGC system permease protein LptF